MVRSRGPRRIGVFGGTFDPPHIGHLVAALEARAALELDVVLLVVANVPWQKAGSRPISAPEDRLAMVREAADGAEGLEVSDLELRRGGASYTADTLADLRRDEPDAELFVILGRDAAAGFATWERYEDVAAAATLVVVDRPGPPVELDGRFAWQRVDIPELELSSTELRERVAAGRSIRYLTTDGVASVIEERGLYR
ncbi:MAG: nicotinate-nucleotide adenylyltransferase [Acidimicrobiales bacterium]|nr:nicotinate-nucleotide adenylyltransferase [Acidimicrobiales bacterium]HRW39652.1 nicotinate-nucleotide adenylyltransferase [Aquihabitans sp.]